ncbi:hypothetical protein Q0N76_15300 [Bacillus altitudinis]|uniref:hypothetical protein n=1 Tax=Bacillus altitudinis TaxID=293387 RepID=UPI003457AE89
MICKIQQVKKQQEYIQSSLLERDKETKKLIAATEQEEKEEILVAVLEIAY